MGLKYTKPMFLIARDRPAKMMFLGGLGAAGDGEMWAPDNLPKRFENWETAPERRCPDAERQCTAEAAFDYRCWGRENHEGMHHAGYSPNERTWT